MATTTTSRTNETKLVTTQALRQRDKPQFRGSQGKPMTTTTLDRAIALLP